MISLCSPSIRCTSNSGETSVDRGERCEERLFPFSDEKGGIVVIAAPAGRERHLDLADVQRADATDRGFRLPLEDNIRKESAPRTWQRFVHIDDFLDQRLSCVANFDQRQPIFQPLHVIAHFRTARGEETLCFSTFEVEADQSFAAAQQRE